MTWLTRRREFEPAVELCRLFPVIPDFFTKSLTNEIKNGNILSVVTETSHACGCGGMADAQDSKSCGGDLVWVQVPPSALKKPCCCARFFYVYAEGTSYGAAHGFRIFATFQDDICGRSRILKMSLILCPDILYQSLLHTCRSGSYRCHPAPVRPPGLSYSNLSASHPGT